MFIFVMFGTFIGAIMRLHITQPALHKHTIHTSHTCTRIQRTIHPRVYAHIAQPIARAYAHIAHPIARAYAHIAQPIARAYAHIAHPMARAYAHIAQPIARAYAHFAQPVAHPNRT